MKNIFIFISFISFALSLETTTTFKIDGMMCGVSCPKAVKKSLNNIEGINNCEVDFATYESISSEQKKK